MILFSNGCSFLTPRPKDNVNTFVTKELSESYNLDLVNLAMGGRGNTRVEFSTKVWVEQNENEKIFAVIGWSNSHRHDYVTDDGWKAGRIPGTELTWRTWKTLDNLNFISKQKGWDVENNADMNFLNNVSTSLKRTVKRFLYTTTSISPTVLKKRAKWSMMVND